MNISMEKKRMSKKKSKFQLAQEKAEATIKETNTQIEKLGKYTVNLYDALKEIQEQFDAIRNVPNKNKLQCDELKNVRLNWKQQAEKIETDYKNAVAKSTGQAAVGVGAGVAVAALGPTAAMGVATTFGVASTGTAISSLSGAAATNAALAWLGGGALAAGGGGMAAGNALLALAGPIGWAIAGVALLSSGLLIWKAKSDKERLENIFTLIVKRDTKSYEQAIVELNERIGRIKEETVKLREAVTQIKTFGTDYERMTEEQQYTLGTYLNIMRSSTQLLVNPILGLQAKYNETDYEKLIIANKNIILNKNAIVLNKDLIIALSNLLYKIELTEKDKKLLWQSFRKNKQMLKTMNVKKKDFEFYIIEIVCVALEYRYKIGN